MDAIPARGRGGGLYYSEAKGKEVDPCFCSSVVDMLASSPFHGYVTCASASTRLRRTLGTNHYFS